MDSFGVLTRAASTMVALILVASSIAALVIIKKNKDFMQLIDSDGESFVKELVIMTRSGVTWTVVLSGITLFSSLASAIVAAMKKETILTLILGIIECILIFIGMFFFLGTGVANAIFASAWGTPPEECVYTRNLGDTEIKCDEAALTAITSILAGLSFVEIGVLSAVVVATMFSIQSSKQLVNKNLPQKL